MPERSRFLLQAPATILLVAAPLLSSTAEADLEAQIRRAIQEAKLGTTAVGVSVRDPEDMTELVEIRDTQSMIPASNMKLFTSGAALDYLGADHYLRTSMLLDGDRLWIVGSGDPAFGDPKLLEKAVWTDAEGETYQGLDVDVMLDLLAEAVAETGIEKLEELVIDDRVFDRNHVHPDWPVDQLDKRYCAEVAGFNLHLNVLRIYPRPGTGSRPDISRTQPQIPWLHLENKATNRRGKGQAHKIGVSRSRGRNDLKVWGNVAHPGEVDVTLSDITSIFGRLMKDRLEMAGVQVENVRVADASDPVPSGRQIDPLHRTHIEELLVRCNTDSHNLYAESLLKMLGHAVESEPGSWENGTRAVRMVVRERIGAEHAKTFKQADGSGLSRNNGVAPETVTAWLSSFHQDPELGPVYIESLAVAGSTGSVRNRMRNLPAGVRVDCKTGHIRGVSCLSGLVSGPDGDSLAFSVLCNEIPGNISSANAKQLQDRIVGMLADHLVAERTALGGN